MLKRIVLIGCLLLVLVPTGFCREKLTIFNYQYLEPGFAQFWKEIETNFEKEYNVDVEATAVPSSSYYDQTLIQLVSGRTADIYYTNDANLGSYIAGGYLEPLDKLLNTKRYNKNFFPTQEKTAMVNGKTYAIMHQTGTWALIYNKRMLAEAGFTRPPRNVEELLSYGQKLTKPPLQYGLAVVDSYPIFEEIAHYLIGFGTSYVVDGKPNAMDPKVIQAHKLYKQIYDSGMHPKGVKKPVLRQMQWEGKIAMRFDGTWYFGMAKAANSKFYDELDAAPVPFPSGLNQANCSGLFIPKAAQNKKLAAKYIDFVNRPANQVKFLNYSTMLPGGPLPEKVLANYYQQNPWFKVFVTRGAYGRNRVPDGLAPVAAQLTKLVENCVASFLQGNESVESANKKLNEELTELLKNLPKQ